MNVNELTKRRAGKIAEMQTIFEKASAEDRDLSGEERTRFDTLTGEVRSLGNRMTDAETLAEFQREEAQVDSASNAAEGRGSEGCEAAEAPRKSGSDILAQLQRERYDRYFAHKYLSPFLRNGI